jgi:NADH/NAD ratio-sensing transcriptional regulator Rex
VTGVTVTEVSEATQAVVDGMVRAGVRRIVAAANGKVLTDDEVTGEYANVAAEHRRDAAILAASGLD